MLATPLFLLVSLAPSLASAHAVEPCRGLDIAHTNLSTDLLSEIRLQLTDEALRVDACARLASLLPDSAKQPGSLASSIPTVTLNPSQFNYGSVAFGSTASTTIEVTNPSAGTISFAPNYPRIASASGAYSLTASTCGASLASSASCTLTVAVAPVKTGAPTGFVDIRINEATGLYSTFLQASVVSPNTHLVDFTPSRHDFGTVNIGTSQSVDVSVRNVGNSSISLETGFPRLIAAHGYSISTNGCTTPLSAGEACTVSVTYAPTASGSHIGLLDIRLQESYSLFTGRQDAIAVAPHTYTVSVSPHSVDMGVVQIGEEVSATIQIANTGTGSVSFTTNSPRLYANGPGGMRIRASTCLASLPPAQQCVVDVDFAPTLPGNYTGFLDVHLVESTTVTTSTIRATATHPGTPPPSGVFTDGFEPASP